MYQWHDRPLRTWLKGQIPSSAEAYAHWRKQNSPFRAERSDERSSRNAVEARLTTNLSWNPHLAVEEAERILNGELKYFAHNFVKTGFPPDWHKDPVSGKRLDSNKHWSEISDDDDLDIKFIWEASRFSMVYALVRAHAATREEKFAEAFWTLIESWAETNPPNAGPNWMDGQEAALRLMAWTFGYDRFLDSPSSTPERIAQFTVLVAAHAERIYKNIAYAISTHSNHTISEAFGLWLVGLLFPELKDAEKYRLLGRRLLEREAVEQIFLDGSYSMYSLNYHRFILQIYLYALRLGELSQSPLSSLVFDRIAASIDYISQLIDPETGQMPVYGSNDGALVLPLNNCDFTDYRPLLQLGVYATKKQFFFEPGPWDEDLFWLYGDQAISRVDRSAGEAEDLREGEETSRSSFPYGGMYLLHGSHSKAVLRCTDFHSRPSHADQLHVDLWWHGVNIACDAGTYLYSGKDRWRNGLAHTAVHNTVTVDGQDQMKMLTRFTWTNWSKGKVLRHDADIWRGEQDGYQRLADPVSHQRTVMSLEGDRWLVLDHLKGRQKHHYSLHWLLSDVPYEQGENLILLSLDSMKCKIQLGLLHGNSAFSVVRCDPESTRGWRSQYYGDREPAISVLLETDQPRAVFWTFFGPASDSIDLAGNTLNISSGDWNTKVDLVS